jgi:hypothetical protein
MGFVNYSSHFTDICKFTRFARTEVKEQPDSKSQIATHDAPRHNTPIHNILSTASTHHDTKHNTPIHNILSTAPQLSISQKALGTLPEDGNVMPKHVGVTIHN